MISVYQLKPAFQNLLRPISNGFVKLGLSANQVTLLSITLSLIYGCLLYIFPQQKFTLLFLPVFMFVRMALNAIDGMIAKEHNMASNLGSILNEVGDVISDIFLYLPFVFLFPEHSLGFLVIILLSMITEFIGVLGPTVGSKRRYDGPMGKSDRAVFFGIFAVTSCLSHLSEIFINSTLGIVIFLLLLTCYNRMSKALNAS